LKAKYWTEGHELHIRFTNGGRVCLKKQSLTLPKTIGVNVEDI